MPDLTGGPVRTFVQPAVHPQCAADPGSERYPERVRFAANRAGEYFSAEKRVDVVVEERRYLERVLDAIGHGVPCPVHERIAGHEDASASRVDDPGRTDADPEEPSVHLAPQRIHRCA